MDNCLSNNKPTLLQSSLLSIDRPAIHSLNFTLNFSGDRRFRRPIRTVGHSGRRSLLISVVASHREFSGLNTPLEPKSVAGKFLGRVLQDDRKNFPIAVAEQLLQMAADRGEAFDRVNLSLDSSEVGLHRRIAELKEQEYQTAVEDVIYMFIFYNFLKIKIHLVPRLSKCIYNGRLEIWSSRDYELESIHSPEALDMIREHLTTVIGWKVKSNVTDNWATTKIQRLQLCRIYTTSVLYGYFLKSASLRHNLELTLSRINYELGVHNENPIPFSESWSRGLKNIVFSGVSSVKSTSVGLESCDRGKKSEKLRSYVMGFDSESLQMCAKPKSKEAVNLIERHSSALFGDEKTELVESDELILTSVSSLKRLVLEAVAFGSFLWDTEEYVDSVYKLKEN